jgi:4-amino-4-deoxy-L-arabinose transferase-like glycosyltransferase
MVETGDLLHLDFRGEERVYDAFMNAPLHYWARAALIAGFGSNLFTMRALSALFGVLCVLATYALGCRLAGRRAGLFSALVLLTTWQFVYLHGARTGELDTLASFLVVAACLSFLRAVRDERSFWPHHLLLAALLMTKLPLVAVPVLAELLWLARHPGDARQLPRYLRTGLLLLPFALLWHGTQAVLQREHVGSVLATMFGQASGARVTDAPDLGIAGNARFYAATLLYGALPWAAAYPFAALAALRAGGRGRRVALLWAAVVLIFFCVVSKHFPWYVLPAYPFLSILVGVWLADLLDRDARWTGWGIGAVAVTLLWIGIDFGADPFAQRALVIPMQWLPRHWLGLAPATAIALLGAIWAGLWTLSGESLPAAWRRAVRSAFVVALLLYAGVRAAAPLAYLDHQSPLDRIHRQLYAARKAGKPLDYPIRLGVAPPQIARFLFGEDFEIVPRAAPRGTALLLYPRGDPKVLAQSIGRAGLEYRFAQARRRSEAPPQGPTSSPPR